MSLADLGKNDISEETQALKDRLASRDTENAGLRTQLMRREVELEELQATLNETVYKLSKEAERALCLEEEVSVRSSELKTERMSFRNAELALQSAQEKLKAEERAKKELESTLDTFSLNSQATAAEHQSVQREKRALESRVRELERIVQTHETKGLSITSRKNGRSRSSSVSNFRLPAVEQELNDIKAQLRNKDTTLSALEQKLAQAQDNLVKAENARISVEKAGLERISELLSMVERKDEELESLRETDNTGEREEQLLQRIDEDAAKIAALEKLVAESQANRTSQTRMQKLQSQLKAECEKVQRSEELQNRLLREKEELLRQYEAAQRDVAGGHESLMARECRIQELEASHAPLLTELDTYRRQKDTLLLDAERSKRPTGTLTFPDESALADHIQTLLQAIDRLRDERDGLKHALEFSEVEYRITTQSYQTHIASLTNQSTENARDVPASKSKTLIEQRMERLSSCATTFAMVISNLQTRLDISEDRIFAISADLTSSKTQLHDVLGIIDSQKQALVTNTREHEVFLQNLDVVGRELLESEEECGRLHLQLADVEGQVAIVMERASASEAAREEAHESFLMAEQRFAILNKNRQDVESERDSLALQITNLRDDLARVQQDLADADIRYNSLHAHQLSEMSTSEVARALRDRIKELEARVTHGNDQIGEYQHDIHRLEANAKLQEERIAEMTSELELLGSQKDAMVEDCAEAREARDDATQRLEAAEEETERIQKQLQEAQHAYEEELSGMTSTLANLASESQQNTAHLASLETENAELLHELDTLKRDYQHLGEQLDAAVLRSRSLELGNSKEHTEMQQIIISLAVIHHEYKECTRRLQAAYQDTTSLQSQRDTLIQELERVHAQIPIGEDGSPLQEEQQNVDDLRNCLEEKELELATARQLLEESEARYTKVEAGLLERIATMTAELHAQAGQTEDVAGLRLELDNVRTQLQTSLENFANLEKLHGEVTQDLISAKEVFEQRLTQTDEQIRTLEADHERTLATMNAKYKHEVGILSSDLEDREHGLEQLRQRLQEISEAHARADGKLHEELKSYEVSHARSSDLEKDLRRTVTDTRQRLAQAESESLALQEERHLLQTQITSLQAEIQRSTSFTRYLESQIRENENACMLLKESLQQAELTLAESEKAGKAAEFNLTLQATQHDKVVAALRREIASLQSGPELRSALTDLEERNQEMDGLLRAKCQEIEEYDDRILETLKANKKLTTKVESLTRKVQALQAKLVAVKNQSQAPDADVTPSQKASSGPAIPAPVAMSAESFPSSPRVRESSAPPPALKHKTHTPCTTIEPAGSEMSVGKKRPAPDDDERDGVPAEGHYSTDSSLRNGPTPRLRRTHGHPASFTPVRGASLRKMAGASSPVRRTNAGMIPSEIITDVTNSPRRPAGQGDAQLKKRSWLGKIRNGAGSQTTSSRSGAFGGQ